jgi:hypothetical protein
MISHHGLTWPFNVGSLYLVYLCLPIRRKCFVSSKGHNTSRRRTWPLLGDGVTCMLRAAKRVRGCASRRCVSFCACMLVSVVTMRRAVVATVTEDVVLMWRGVGQCSQAGSALECSFGSCYLCAYLPHVSMRQCREGNISLFCVTTQ